MKKVSADYNMKFNNGSFVKGNIYEYKENPKDSTKVFVTTEEGKEQDLWYSEFNVLFTIVEI